MMSEDDVLQDECMREIQDICKNAKDWQEALESIAENYNHIGDKKIVQIVMGYFFPQEKYSTEGLINAN